MGRRRLYRTNAARQRAYRERGRARTVKKDEPWMEHWKGMPEYVQENLKPFKSLHVHFATREDLEAFAKLINKKIRRKTKYIWFPEIMIRSYAGKAWIDEK